MDTTVHKNEDICGEDLQDDDFILFGVILLKVDGRKNGSYQGITVYLNGASNIQQTRNASRITNLERMTIATVDRWLSIGLNRQESKMETYLPMISNDKYNQELFAVATLLHGYKHDSVNQGSFLQSDINNLGRYLGVSLPIEKREAVKKRIGLNVMKIIQVIKSKENFSIETVIERIKKEAGQLKK